MEKKTNLLIKKKNIVRVLFKIFSENTHLFYMGAHHPGEFVAVLPPTL